ncbi:MAG TPA: hypothetical protein VFI46_06520 [Jiangellaceae bacterium]|nr:hypothetical protein [Jiangellaceae bacterium]
MAAEASVGSAARGFAGHFIQAAHVGPPELDQLIVVQAGDQASRLPKTSAEFRAEQLLIDGLIVK